MDRVTVYGFPDCEHCESAKKDLKKLNIPFEEKLYKDFTSLHEGWREDGSIKVMAARHFYGEGHVPLIRQNGSVFDVQSFMEIVKTPTNEKEENTNACRQVCVQA